MYKFSAGIEARQLVITAFYILYNQIHYSSIAKIVFFDTRKEIGVFTEIMGITEEGEKAVEK